MFYEKAVLAIFSKFTGKHPYLIHFLNKITEWGSVTLLERDSDWGGLVPLSPFRSKPNSTNILGKCQK